MRIWGEKLKIIHGLYHELNRESKPQIPQSIVYVVFFHLLTVEYKGYMKIIRNKIMQQAEKSY